MLLAFAVIALVASVAFVVTGTSAAGAGSQPATGTSTSGDAWIPLRSQSPADILTAARSGALFKESRADSGDHVRDLSRLGDPVYVQALRPVGVTAVQVPDFYVVPILNEAGATTDAAELALNSAQTAVQEIAIVTYTLPRAGGSIASLRADQAVSAVASQRHVAAAEIGHSYLVYFPMDPQWQTSQNGKPLWTAGGALPADPIWLVPAAEGSQYLTGNDGKAYTLSQLPVWTGQS